VRIVFANGRDPVPSGISRWLCRHISQEVCPWNERFALALREQSFRPREVIAGKDAHTLSHDILAMDDENFRIAFKGSPMKRAKLGGLKRNAAVVLANMDVASPQPRLAEVITAAP
jgi:epoxyqueuosine reductase QueG